MTQELNKNNPAFNLKRRQRLSIIYIVIPGIIISMILFMTVRRWETMDQHREFEFLANAYCTSIEKTLEEYIGALKFLGDFFNCSPKMVTRAQFSDVVDSIMARYPGIRAFGWDPLVKVEDRVRYELNARREGFKDFEFTERSEKNKLVRAKHRDEYVVVYYIHPMENNRAAFGYDIASNPVRKAAITKSFETGKLNATGRLTLVQETENQFGVLILLPVYHPENDIPSASNRPDRRKGFVVEVLNIGPAVESALKNFKDVGINAALCDMSAAPSNQLLYIRPSNLSTDAESSLALQNDPSPFLWTQTINFAERNWKIGLWPTKAYMNSRVLWQSWIILFGSIGLTSILTLFMYKRISHTLEIENRIEIQKQTNQQLTNEIRDRTSAEQARDKIILKLQKALEEVETLRGIIPICSFCKKIRDDKGYWEQVDVYIDKHSQANLSHGICPDCIKKHYPDEFNDKKTKG